MLKKKLFCYCLLAAAIFTSLVVFSEKFLFDVILVVHAWIKVYYRYMWDPRLHQMFSFNEALQPLATSGNNLLEILIWTPFFGWMILDPNLCPGCVITYDRSSIQKASAVVFHFSETGDHPSWLPLKDRVDSQRWVWYCMEPPWNVRYVFKKTLTPLNGIFNWTMTYRLDSDVLSSYSLPLPSTNKTVNEIIGDKTENALGAWVGSNCNVKHRMNVLNELSNYIAIDRFGKCSNQTLCKGPCEKDTLYKYKFYFAFENSFCKDYITEKFWVKAISYLVVPVVMGPPRRDYELVAPPNSFIHVDDFDSVKSLADYLLKLDRDDELYGKYLQWMVSDKNKMKSSKPMIKFTSGVDATLHPFERGICSLCEKLKQEPSKNNSMNVIENLDAWWFGKWYSSDSNVFSICSYKGPSGYPLCWHISIIYYLFLSVLVAIIFWKRAKCRIKI